MRGFNRHEDTAATGMTPNPEQTIRDLQHIRSMGGNFVRLCHYPHHPAPLRARRRDFGERLSKLGAEMHQSAKRPRFQPEVAFPEGFSVRPYQPGDERVWTDIWRDAEPLLSIDDNLFAREFGSDWGALRWRCFFIVDERGCAVGTVTAWYSRDFKGQDWGRIHWLAVRPAYQGRDLAKAAMSFALKQLAQWHERAWLDTSGGRLGAIKIYLDFGFVPDMDAPGAKVAWQQVQQKLNHPMLARYI